MLPQRKHGLRTPHRQQPVTGFGCQKSKAESLQLLKLAKPPAQPFKASTAQQVCRCRAIWFSGKQPNTAEDLEVLRECRLGSGNIIGQVEEDLVASATWVAADVAHNLEPHWVSQCFAYLGESYILT